MRNVSPEEIENRITIAAILPVMRDALRADAEGRVDVPLRAGWRPLNVRAILSDIVKERPDGKGGIAPCKTWDNGTLFCEAGDPVSGEPFPLTVKLQRIAPGQKNTWYTEVLGTRASARFSTKNPKRLELLNYAGGEQG